MTHRDSISFSVRRHFVDAFFTAQAVRIAPGTVVLDVGGQKNVKRGLFDIGMTGARVTYVNIDPVAQPDVVADAAALPMPDASYNAVIMGELLEHVPDPRAVLLEACRVLKPGGTIVATVPFLFPVHADPHDYGRYTDAFWRKAAAETGFFVECIEAQGTLYAVAALAVQHFFQAPSATRISRVAKGVLRRLIRRPAVALLMRLDQSAHAPLLRAWTTGYGFVLRKP